MVVSGLLQFLFNVLIVFFEVIEADIEFLILDIFLFDFEFVVLPQGFD
jgi:hypothetical protein